FRVVISNLSGLQASPRDHRAHHSNEGCCERSDVPSSRTSFGGGVFSVHVGGGAVQHSSQPQVAETGGRGAKSRTPRGASTREFVRPGGSSARPPRPSWRRLGQVPLAKDLDAVA